MAVDERAFAELLRFYPKRWREENGEDFLANTLEDARARGLERPDRDLVRSAMIHGWGTRLTPGLAIGMALIGCFLAYVFGWFYTGLFPVVDPSYISRLREEYKGVYLLVENTVGLLALPFVSLTAIASLLRFRGRLSPPRAVGLVAGGTASFACWWLASAIRVAIEETRGMAAQPILDVISEVGTWLTAIIMVIAVAFAASELLEGVITSRALRWAAGLALGAPIGMIVLALTGIPGAWILIDPGVLAAAIALTLRERLRSPETAAQSIDEAARARRDRPRRTESLPLSVKVLVSVLVLLVLVFASWESFLGLFPGISSLFGSGAATAAARGLVFVVGRAFVIVAPITLFIAWGIVDSALRRHSLASIWGPIAFFCAAWAFVCLLEPGGSGIGGALWRAARALPVFTDPKGFDIFATALFVVSVPGVIGVVDRYAPRRWFARILVAAIVAVAWYFAALAVYFGMVPFFIPLGALILLLRAWTARRTVSGRVSPGGESPVREGEERSTSEDR